MYLEYARWLKLFYFRLSKSESISRWIRRENVFKFHFGAVLTPKTSFSYGVVYQQDKAARNEKRVHH